MQSSLFVLYLGDKKLRLYMDGELGLENIYSLSQQF